MAFKILVIATLLNCYQVIFKYSRTSENGLPLLWKPPQCGQESVVLNCIALYYSCYKETSVLRTPPK